MENLDKKEEGVKPNGCSCGMGHMHGCHGGRHCLVKMILKIIIIILIFWCGYKLGEMTGAIRSGYGHNNFRMLQGGYSNLPNNIGGNVPVPTTAVPAQ
jgi:hypothetical protein